MAKLLFKLRGVPDDEADDIRELLTHHEFDFYETSAGNWGLSMPGMWLNDEQQFQEARRIIDEYQKTRAIRVRAEYARLKKEGKIKTFIDRVKENPIQIIFFLFVLSAFFLLVTKLLLFEVCHEYCSYDCVYLKVY